MFDVFHRALGRSPLLARIAAEAMGDRYPSEVEPSSCASWWFLGQAVAGLRLRPGALLVDLGCGRGGPGIWVARAMSATLVGVDFSEEACRLAAERAGAFGLADRSSFRVAPLDRTGLPDGCADGLLSVDALYFADSAPALREVHRILVPGGRAVFTANQGLDVPLGSERRWDRRIAAAGLVLEDRIVDPVHNEDYSNLCALWVRHADAIRAEVGDEVTDGLLAEAAEVAGVVTREKLLLVVRRP
jgi:cyclopropane fatty-acyl-phospholipid synthase-like methyltransferase